MSEIRNVEPRRTLPGMSWGLLHHARGHQRYLIPDTELISRRSRTYIIPPLLLLVVLSVFIQLLSCLVSCRLYLVWHLSNFSSFLPAIFLFVSPLVLPSLPLAHLSFFLSFLSLPAFHLFHSFLLSP